MTEAMIGKLSIRAWGATRTDKEVSEEVARSKGAGDNAGRYVKNLIDRSALKRVRSCVQNLRDKHRELTRPWDDDGRRLIPMGIMEDHEYEIGQLIGEFDDAVAEFVREYPGLRDYAQMNLGELFNEADYPSDDQIADKFSVEVELEPMPKGENAPPGYAEAVEASVKRRMKASADELFYRIVDALKETSRKLKAHDEREQNGDKRGRFRLSVMDDLKLLTDLLPALNIENDPFLKGIHNRLLNDLDPNAIRPEDLRDVGVVRTSVMGEIDEIVNVMEQNKP